MALTMDKETNDLYKMEYERCSVRYDDLYKAAWTNFSYIALISGAILTFGSDSFMTELSIFLATVPLLFWWIASFEPLNRYGDQVQARAACIEKLLNELVGLGEHEEIDVQEQKRPECLKGLRHFQDFEKRQFTIRWPKLLIVILFWATLIWLALQVCFYPPPRTCIYVLAVCLLILWGVLQFRDSSKRLWHILRVRFIVRVFAGTIMIVATCSAYGAYRRHQLPEKAPYIKSNSAESNSNSQKG